MPADAAHYLNGYCLRLPETDAEWQAYHGIRRRVFHLPRPEVDQSPDSYPMVFFLQERVIGAIQVDRLGEAAPRLAEEIEAVMLPLATDGMLPEVVATSALLGRRG